MANLSVKIRYSATVDELKRNIAEGIGTIDAMKASVDRTAAAMGGQGLFIAANKLTAAIEQLGGVTKLTASEQERASATLDKAIEKYKVMGMTAPPAMVAIRDELQQTRGAWGTFVDGFDVNAAMTQPLATAKGAVSALAQELGPFGVAAAAAAASAAAIGGAMYELAEHAASLGGKLNDMSEKTGISVPAISNLGFAAKVAGTDIETVSGAIFKFQQNLGEGSDKFTGGLQRLGLSIEQIKDLAPDQQFLAVAKALRETEDPSERAAAGVALFGKQFRDLAPLMMKPLDELVDKARQLGITWSEEDARAAEEFEMAQSQLKLTLSQTAITVGRDLIPTMQTLVGIMQWFAEHQADVSLVFGLLGGRGVDLSGAKELQQTYGEVGVQLEEMIGHLKGPALQTTQAYNAEVTNTSRVEQELTEQLKKQQEEQKKSAALWAAYNAVGTSTADTIARMDGAVVEAIRYDLQRGQAVETLSKVYGLEKEQIDAVSRAMKDEQDALEATIRRIEEYRAEGLKGAEAVAKGFGGGQEVLKSLGVQMGNIPVAAKQIQTSVYVATDGMGKGFEQVNGVIGLMPDLTDRAAQHMKQLGDKGTSVLDQLKGSLGGLNDIFQRAFEGGGGVGGAIQSFATNIGKNLLNAIPVVGPFISQFAGSIVAGLKKIFGGPSAAELAGRDLVAKFEQSMGGWQGIQKALLATGMAADEVNAKIQAMWSAEKQGGAAVQAQIDGINATITQHATAVQGGIDAIVAAAKTAGGTVPPALQPILQKLIDMQGLTAEQKKALGDLAASAAPDFESLISKASSLGLTLQDLGPKFQAAHVSDQADNIYGTLQSLVNAGADVGGTLYGLRKPLSQLVVDATKAGADIPIGLKPYLDELARSGNLLDENGKKITDLGGITFKQSPIEKGFSDLATAIQNLTDLLAGKGGVTDAIGAVIDRAKHIPKKIDVDVTLKGHWDIPSIRGDEASGAAQGGFVTSHGIVQHFAAGGTVLPFIPRGTDTVPAMLTPGEAVLTRGAVARLGVSAISALNRGGGLGASDEALRSEVRGLRDDLRQQAEQARADQILQQRRLAKELKAMLQQAVA